MKISLIENHAHVQIRTTKSGKTFYYQNAYAHTGGVYPTLFELPVRDPANSYPVGDYELDPASFRVGTFKNLELNQYDIKLIAVSAKK